jgi:hypothetical protein
MNNLELILNQNLEGFGNNLIKNGLENVHLDSLSRATQLFELGLEFCVVVDEGKFQNYLSIDLRDNLFFDESLLSTKDYDDLFARAFTLCLFYDEKCVNFSNQIASYLHTKYSNECTCFLYSFCLIKLKKFAEAYSVLISDDSFWRLPSIIYLKGQAKLLLGKNACSDFYEALSLNHSSSICAKYLFQEVRKHDVILECLEGDASDSITEKFIATNVHPDEFELVHKTIYQDLDRRSSFHYLNVTENGNPYFIEFLKRNEKQLLVGKDRTIEESQKIEEELWNQTEPEFNPHGNKSKYGGYNGYDDKTIDNAFEGDPENTN